MRLLLLIVLSACQANENNVPQAAPTDCTRVGAQLAGFELGPGAPKDQRDAAAIRYRDLCMNANVPPAEAQCLAKAKTTWNAKGCVPSMFKGTHAGGDCKAVAQKMKDAVLAVSGSASPIEKLVPAIEVSCEQDNWPAEMKNCVLGAKPAEMARCNGMLSKELQDKLARRMLIITQHGPNAP